MSDSLKSLAESLGSRVAALESRARATVALACEVRTALATEVANHIVSASYRADTLVVMTDSSAWSAQVRYAETDLRRHFAARSLPGFTRLKVRVQRPAETALAKPTTRDP